MQESDPGYLNDDVFKTVIENMPMVSVDLLVKHKGRVMLGKRLNRPAKGYWFTLGGRVLKNEPIKETIRRIGQTELGQEIDTTDVAFVGIFEHFYDDSIFEGVSTHYINLVYEIELSDIDDLPTEQHSEYRWFEVDALMQSDEVHRYIKDIFTKEMGTVPQKKES